jgi:hypothetical protein
VPARSNISGRTAHDKRLAAGRPCQTKQHPDGGALACTVRAQKAENLTAPDLQGKIPDCDLVAVDLTQATRFDRELIGRVQGEVLYCFSESASATAPLESPKPVSE